MQLYKYFILALISLSISFNTLGQDSTSSKFTINSHLGFDITNVGYYGNIGGQINYKKIGFGIAYIIDYSDADLPFDGPFGLAANLAYSPNYSSNKIINHFINLDYRITFHKRFCKYDCNQKYNKIQEFNIGYGLSIKIFKNLFLSNTINIGWYFEKSLSDRTNKTITENGSNSLLNIKLHYTIVK
jgi:hypothetical protein